MQTYHLKLSDDDREFASFEVTCTQAPTDDRIGFAFNGASERFQELLASDPETLSEAEQLAERLLTEAMQMVVELPETPTPEQRYAVRSRLRRARRELRRCREERFDGIGAFLALGHLAGDHESEGT